MHHRYIPFRCFTIALDWPFYGKAEAFLSLFSHVLLTPASSSCDPLADVCRAILELDVAGFAVP